MVKGKSINSVTKQLIEKLLNEDNINITLFYGKDVKEKDTLKLQETLKEKYPEHEVTMLKGDQPVYYYIISLE